MLDAGTLLELYHQSVENLYQTFDMSADGSNQKTFHVKYDALLYNLLLYLLCTQFISKPMVITLRKYENHPFYYNSDGLHCGDNFIPLLSIHHIAINSMIDEHPNRIYLFNNSMTEPSQLNSTETKVMSNYLTKMLSKYNKQLSVKMFKQHETLSHMMSMMLARDAQLRIENVKLENENKILRDFLSKYQES